MPASYTNEAVTNRKLVQLDDGAFIPVTASMQLSSLQDSALVASITANSSSIYVFSAVLTVVSSQSSITVVPKVVSVIAGIAQYIIQFSTDNSDWWQERSPQLVNGNNRAENLSLYREIDCNTLGIRQSAIAVVKPQAKFMRVGAIRIGNGSPQLQFQIQVF